MHRGVYGSFPERTSCPANGSGYGPHETDASSLCPIFRTVSYIDPTQTWDVHPCTHCGALFVVRGPAE